MNKSSLVEAATGPGHWLTWILRQLVMIMAVVAGVGLAAMMLITCVDVLLRLVGYSFKGAYDLVKIAGAVTIAGGLPYTTAVKGHVAVEFFFQQLGRRGRVVVDGLARLLGVGLFGVLAWHSVRYGNTLRSSGEVSMTLQLPIFWVPYVIAFSCAVVVAVKIYHLFHPGKELIKP